MNVSPFWKTIVAAAMAVVVGLEAALVGDSTITQQEWVSIGLAALTAIFVYFVPNKA